MRGIFGKSSKCTSGQKVTAALLLSFLTFGAPALISAESNVERNEAQHILPVPGLPGPSGHDRLEADTHRFTLRHVYHHGTHLHPGLHRKKDVRPDSNLFTMSDDGHVEVVGELVAQSQMTDIQRLKDRRPSTIEPMLAAARELGYPPPSPPSAWVIDSVLGPNVSHKETVVNLAEMAANAYAIHENSTDWNDIDVGFNRTDDFGWEGDGLRGHVYADENNSTIVIGIKGTTPGWPFSYTPDPINQNPLTSPAVFDGDGTTTNDKFNDNLFASCCCGQQGVLTWLQVCDCATSAFTCNRTCVVQALRNESRYYAAARNIYTNVTKDYPTSNIWLVGHSLGGAVSGLLGLTYGLPAVTFEAVPEALAASRLGLPQPPDSIRGAHQSRSMTGNFHFGHTADPVYMGACNGGFSFCSMAGYAFESQCHTGQRCVYDVVGDKGWRLSIRTHSIRTVIETVLKVYDEAADCAPEPECQDCYNWNYYDSNNSSPSTTRTTTTSTSKTRTRTSTCKTPGWWGCLDEDETTTTTTTSTSSRIITTTTTTSASTSSTTSTTTCETPGWFGRCLDETTTSDPAYLHTVTTTRAHLHPTRYHDPPSADKQPPMTTTPSIV